MSTRIQRDKDKKQQEEFQAILRRLLLEEDNKYCADCDAKGPRWASWNIGVFLCIRCAGIHRNLGVHISKVKSVNLDTWTEKQIATIDSLGNRICREVYEANLPESFRRPQTDSPLEHFIRAKYEHKKYIDRELEKKILAKTPVLRNEPEKDKKKKSSSSQGKSVTLQKLAKVPGPAAPNQSPSKARPAAIDASAFQQTKAPAVVSSAPTTPPKSSMDDLLGLDTPKVNNTDDPFGLSTTQSGASLAPGPQLAASASAPSLTSLVPQSAPNGVANDVDLFGPAPDTTAPSATQGQTSKESILALFGNQPTTKQQMYNVPGGLYIPSQQPNQPQQQMMMNPQQTQGYQQGMMGMQATQQQGMMGVPATQQQGMMGVPATQQGMMGRPVVQQQVMMGRPGAQQQGMIGMPATQPQGMVGANMGYPNAMQQQQAYLQQFQNQQANFTRSPSTSTATANSARPGQSPPVFPNHQPTNTMHMQQPYMHMQQKPADTNTLLWQQHMYNHRQPMDNQPAYGHQPPMNNQQVYGHQPMNNQQAYGHQLMNNQQGQSAFAPQQFASSQRGTSSAANLMQTSTAQPGGGGVTSQLMHMQQPDVNQVQAQIQNMKVGGNPGTNVGQTNGPAGQQANGPAASMNGQFQQQQPGWNAGVYPSMQQAQGVPVQGNMAWSGNMAAGQTLSTQLWK